MNSNEKFVLDTIDQYNENARNAHTQQGLTFYFEPMPLKLNKRIPIYCAHCRRKIGVDSLTIYCNDGILTADDEELPSDATSVIVTCSQCGSRVYVTPDDVRNAITRNGKLIKRIVVLLALMVAVFVGFSTFSNSKLGQEYYNSAQEAIRQNDYETAVADLVKADRHGSVEAAYLLGQCYQNGTGVEADADKAEKWFQKAEENGSQLSKCAKGKAAFEAYIAGGDTTQLSTAVDLLENCTESEAKYELSVLYRGGVGVTQDKQKADSLLQEATEGGNIDAMCEMAYQQILAQNASGALEILQQAVDPEDPRVVASKGYANLFANNVNEGVKQLTQASLQGNGLADFYWGEVYYNSMLTGADRDTQMSYTYYKSSADKGCIRGKIGLAMCELIAGEAEASQTLAQECYNRGYAEAGSVLALHTDDETLRMNYVNAAVAVGYSPAEIWRANYNATHGDTNQSLIDLTNAYHHGAMLEANRCAVNYLGAAPESLGPNLLS